MKQRVFLIADHNIGVSAVEVMQIMLRAEAARERTQIVLELSRPELKQKFERALLEEAKRQFRDYRAHALQDMPEPPDISVLREFEKKKHVPDVVIYREKDKPREQVIREKPWLRRKNERW